MSDGSPMRILSRQEAIDLPPALVLQGSEEIWTSDSLIEGFAEAYHRRGGEIEVVLFDGEKHDFIRTNPASLNSQRALEKIRSFIMKKGT
jgi:acetyl esterase/lipase